MHEHVVPVLVSLVSKKERAKSYRRYRKAALAIHKLACRNKEWCNYGEPEDPELADDISLPWPERQRRARERLTRMHHCQYAVNAENIAARYVR